MEPLDVGALFRSFGPARSCGEVWSLAEQGESNRRTVAKLLAEQAKVVSFRKARGRS